MILLPPAYLDRPVELFEEDDAGQGVRKRDVPEGQALVGLSEHLGGEAERAAEDERDVAATGGAKRGEPPREFLRGVLLPSLAVQGYHVGCGWESPEQALAFGGAHLFVGAAVHVYFRDLDDLDGEVAPETAKVVV